MVLAYHQIVREPSSYKYSVTCADLEDHLRLVTDFGTTSGPDASATVTFDDGHVSQYTNALPLLEKFRIPAVFCVTAGWTGTNAQYMNVVQLRELISLGHQVQAHGWSHKMLTLCSPSELREELQHSKETLEERLGIPIEAVSIPHGRWNKCVLEVCAHAGYKRVYVSDPSIGSVDTSGVRLIGRLMVTQVMSTQALEMLLRPEHKSIVSSRIKAGVKRGLRAVLGETGYHRLWRLLSSDPDRPAYPISSGQPAKILHLISSEGFYGAESMLVNLTKTLKATTSWNSVIAVFHNSHNPHVEIAHRAEQNGLPVEIIPCAGRMAWSAVREVKRIIFKHGVDIVHTHGYKANFYGTLAGGLLGIPLVATYHLDWPDRSFQLHAYHLLDRVLLRRFRKIVAVSQAIELSLRRAGLGDRVRTIANGIDVDPFLSAAEAELGNLETRDQKPLVVGVVGRLTPQKGHRYLLETAPGVLAKFPEVSFLFVGDGPERDNLKQMVASLGLERNVVFAGSRSDMPAVYALIDILVLPSLNEGMPMTLIEGLAARRPVIATSVGDVPKLIRNGETGILVAPADPEALKSALIQLLSDPRRRSELAGQGRRWVCERFSADAMARRYIEAYAEILGREDLYDSNGTQETAVFPHSLNAN